MPRSLTSALVTVVSGLTLVRLGCGMREPVTTSSWIVDPLDPPEASGFAVGRRARHRASRAGRLSERRSSRHGGEGDPR